MHHQYRENKVVREKMRFTHSTVYKVKDFPNVKPSRFDPLAFDNKQTRNEKKKKKCRFCVNRALCYGRAYLLALFWMAFQMKCRNHKSPLIWLSIKKKMLILAKSFNDLPENMTKTILQQIHFSFAIPIKTDNFNYSIKCAAIVLRNKVLSFAYVMIILKILW